MKGKKATYKTIDLTKTPPTAAELRELCRKLGATPRELLRKKDPAYAELKLEGSKHSDTQLLELIAKHPGLLRRPILVRGSKAVVARPAEAAQALL